MNASSVNQKLPAKVVMRYVDVQPAPDPELDLTVAYFANGVEFYRHRSFFAPIIPICKGDELVFDTRSKELGDQMFLAGLQERYAEFLHKPAAF